MGALVPTGCSNTWCQSNLTIGLGLLFADDAAGLCPPLDDTVRFCDLVTTWTEVNEMPVGISKCGLADGILARGSQCEGLGF